ncbi:T9SS type A sorting domain-containing protein [Psychroserpens mesophilus]|uniref:T9SS type A sorting domain-containing protein n=1 Tax=Psychroserpens mesophilus TaxID=325473 RepID=UPI00058F0F03|nr:T9SS type A sorting domain-containing protein [Psychroserpens mesophilus]
MNKLLPLLFAFPFLCFSQCPPTGGTFTSQAQIDALAIDYPNCTEVGYFFISGDDITDLSGLSQIESCTYFSISGNLVLQNTIGLNPNLFIRYVEGTGTSFDINNNASLLTIDGLENFVCGSGFESSFSISDNPMLTSVEGAPNSFSPLTWFYIDNNDSLINLNGLENYGAGEFTSISDNDSLIDLTGLHEINGEIISISDNDNLQTLNGTMFSGFEDYLYIENNLSLTDISGIWAGDWLVYDLVIRNNPNLSMCSSENVCNFFTSNIEEYEMLRGTFENNAPGCNSVFEAEYGCGVNSNDNCGYTPYLLTIGETITANNEFATTSSQTPSCNDIANRKDVWFVFDSEDNTIIDVFVQAGFYLQLWEGDYCGDITQVDNACGTQLIDISVTMETRYYIQVWNDDTVDRGGSSWFDLTVQDASLSTQEFQLAEVKLFPNPVNDVLHMQSNSIMENVEIFNLLGQRIKAFTFEPNNNTIDMSALTDGIYLVQLSVNGNELTYKVIKD